MTTAPAISTWAIDPVHSVPEFSVKHMVISTVKGRFTKVEGAIMLDEANPANSSVKATIDVTTIDTGEAQRDTHLRSADFFDVEKFPTIAFTSSKVERKSDDEYKVTGDLTIRAVTRPVVLDVEYEGQIKDAYGKQRAAFTATTQIDRKDFGLNWNMALEAGGFIVSNNVKVTLHIAAVRND
jgi:polyisoprenoid-binding protein YceI